MNPKILFIMHVPPPIHGASMVGKYIHDSSIINGFFDTDYINLSTSVKIGEGGKTGLSKFTKLLSIQVDIIRALFKKNYDLCYVTLTASGLGFYKDLLVVSLLKLFGKKIIYHFHNKGVGAARKTKLNTLLYRYAFKNTFSILLSKHLYSDIEDYANVSNVSFCANGIKENGILTRQIQKDVPRNFPVRFLFLSNMIEEKGVYVLLEACKILKEKGLNFECNFAGAWSDISADGFNTKILLYGLSQNVYAHGPRYNEDKQKLFTESDVFVFPTFYHFEAFPLVILEAMQYGLPVVSCPEGGIPDIIVEAETGFLVAQRNVKALADKLQILIENPDLRVQMGLAGKNRFEELFRLEIFENNMMDILRTAVSTTPIM